jgi:hypothetical protein
MIHSSDAQGHYLVTANLGTVYLQVVGLGSMNNCFSLQDFLHELHGKGYCQFIFDLKECRGFDSSFMGVLIGLCNRQPAETQETVGATDTAAANAAADEADVSARAADPQPVAHKVIIVNCCEDQRKLLSSVGVDRVVDLCQQPVNFPVPEAKLSRVKQEPVGMERQLRSIVKAHQDLIQLDGANEEKFGAFLNLVRQELEKHS